MAFPDLLNFLRTEYRPAPGEFLQIDRPNLAAKMLLRERGRERGIAGIPHPNAGTFDEVENEIVEGIRSHALDEEKRTYDQLSFYAQRLHAADPHGTAAEMRAIATQSVAQFEAEALAAKNELEHGHLKLVDIRRALQAFRTENNLTRPAKPPKNHVLLTGALFVMFGLETTPNAVLFGTGDDMGVAGGYMIAIIFSALNLAIGFISGMFCWRNVGHRKIWRRLAGFSAAIALAAAAIFLNLLVGHIRQDVSAGQTTTEAMSTSLAAMVAHPLALHDAMGIGLAAVGIIFSLFATLEGIVWIDPYPGYGAISKQADKAEADWTRLVEERLGYLNDVQRKHSEQLLVARGTLRDRRAEIPEIVNSSQRLIRNFNLHIQHLQGVGRYALSAYRDENRAARGKDVPYPRHFDEEWSLSGITPPEAPLSPPTSEKEWKSANDALEMSMTKLQGAFQAAMAWIGALTTEKSSSANEPDGMKAA